MRGWQTSSRVFQHLYTLSGQKDFVEVEVKMCFQKESFLLEINLRYLQVSFGCKIGLPSRLKSKEGRLKFLVNLEK